MNKLALAAFCVLLAVPALAKPVPSGPATVSLKPADWDIRFSPGQPNHPGNGWVFAFPQNNSAKCPGSNCPAIHYVTTKAVTGKIALGQTLTATFTVTGVASVWNHITEKDGNTTGGSPASVRMFFQQKGDNLTGQGKYAYYRWWSNPISVALAAGTFTITVPLTPANWSSVFGAEGNASVAATAGFNGAIANLNNLGFTFGGGSFFGHGLNLTSGTATFTLTGYGVTP